MTEAAGPLDLRRIAYHEAGHALAGMRLGHRPVLIDVRPSPSYTFGGPKRVSVPFTQWDAGNPTPPFDAAVIALAAACAEQAEFGTAEPGGYRRDEQQARDAVAQIAPEGSIQDRILEEARISASRIISSERDALQALAALLLRSTRVSGEAAWAVVGALLSAAP